MDGKLNKTREASLGSFSISSDIINIFDQDDLLNAYDQVLSLARHYQNVLSIHLGQLAPCDEIIDLGCGTGIPTIELLKAGKRVTGVDISSKSLNVLKDKAIKHGYSDRLTLLQADVTNLAPVPNDRFDGASSMIVAHLLEDYEEHVRETYRVLKPNGRFVITARGIGGDPERLVESVRGSLEALGEYEHLERSFSILAKKLLRTANMRSHALISAQEAQTMLRNVGFNNIQKIENETLGVMYSLCAHKSL